MKLKSILFIGLMAFIMAACSNATDGTGEVALLEIDFSEGKETRPAGLVYKIEITGTKSFAGETNNTIYQEKVPIGTYTVTVTAFNGGTEYASGKRNKEVTMTGIAIDLPIFLNISGYAARPTAEPGTGKYIQGQKITLETTTPGPGVEIRYTTNGTTPTGSSTLYTAPITLNNTITLKAIAIKSGLINSAVLEVTYTVIPLEMILIYSGTFQMGSPTTEIGRYSNETQHSVTLTKNFNMGKYQVTQEQYECVMGTNPSYFHGGTGREPATGEVQAKRPVEYVTWYDAVEFCNKLSEIVGLQPVYTITGIVRHTDGYITSATVTPDWNKNGYRLPTEAEWEYACRAGKTTAFNDGTNDWNSFPDTLGWYTGNSNTGMTYKGTHEVGKKTANVWGLHDMHGNVYEWCWDWYGASYYSSSPSSDPTGPDTSASRVIRGGSWGSDAQYLRSAYRRDSIPSNRGNGFGFRLLRP